MSERASVWEFRCKCCQRTFPRKLTGGLCSMCWRFCESSCGSTTVRPETLGEEFPESRALIVAALGEEE